VNYGFWDPDAYEIVTWFTPCHCGGNPAAGTCKAPGMCTASGGVSQKLRPPEDYARIKAEKLRVEEEDILRRADAIRARRYQG
jgi:hypothetical protein